MRNQKSPFQLDVVSVRLVKDAPIYSEHPINDPEDVVALLGECMCEMDREVVCVVNLKNDGKPINCHFASIGVLNQALIQPRELFKASILSNAASMILIHNHPSANLLPSKEDTMITDRIVKLGELMGIPLLDHVIVGGNNTEFFSFKEKKILPTPKIVLQSDYTMLDFKQPLVAEKGRGR